MKEGDLVKDIRQCEPYSFGIIIEIAHVPGKRKSKAFRVLWSAGTVKTAWNHDLKVINENRM